MQRSIYLAKLIGPLLAVIGAGLLINPAVYRATAGEFLDSYALIYLSGLLVLPASIALVLAHNVWVAGWQVIITVFGWLGIIGGTIRILAPQFVRHLGDKIYAHPALPTAAGAVVFALGALLSYYGYVEILFAPSSRVRKRSRKS